MGEIVRLAIQRLTTKGLLFNGQDSEALRTRGQFLTKYVSEIESDEPETFTKCMNVMEILRLNHATQQDCIDVRYICECVSSRAAHLLSAGVAALINKIDEPSVTVKWKFIRFSRNLSGCINLRSVLTVLCTAFIQHSTI